MISNAIVSVGLVCVILCSWNLVQQNAIGKEPYSRTIGLTYGVVSMGAVAWLCEPVLPFGDVGEPLFIGGLAVNLLVISLRLRRLYEVD